MRKRAPRSDRTAYLRRFAQPEIRDWRDQAREGLALEPIDARPLSPAGTLVAALLQLAYPASEIAAICHVSVSAVRSTVAMGKGRRPRPAPFSDSAVARLSALLGVAVARDQPVARALAEADALAVGCSIPDLAAQPSALLASL